jgi:Kef-type K+ transport system membrane component KefB
MNTMQIASKRLPFSIVLPVAGAAAAAAMLCGAAGGAADEVSNLLIALAVILVGGRIAGELFERIHTPSVMGELVFGVLLGNLSVIGITRLEFIKADPLVSALADLGVILLLFYVGVQSRIREMLAVGWSAFAVATVGIIAPALLGWGVSWWLQPHAPPLTHVFVGTILCATSVGITARVLTDLGCLRTPEARIILGAAVIDDVQGLVVLAIMAGLVRAVAVGGESSVALSAVQVTAKAAVFVVGAVAVGRYLAPALFRVAAWLRPAGSRLTVSLVFCFALAWLAHAVGLAFIVGAFLAGLVIEEPEAPLTQAHPQGRNANTGAHPSLGLTDRLHPIVGFLAPVFFVRTGAIMDLSALASKEGALLALALTAAAVIGKQACALGVLQRGLDRISVGIGMIPRGEVGLIFATMGATLLLPGGQAVVDHTTYGAVIVVVVATTLMAPPVLRWSLQRGAGKRAPSPDG